ncbi:hypothetical protein HPB48_018730 [Haemaphysalis longicornis]|uniref:Ran-specific GTPase-activating protein n=1 Tax=Haemaphysalis longicornis TaxID=44386 RepID=A0A9J6GS00_HAELO|nr:hypothetical protein HPB48_018730 [Haemaphysalis longicornis]
MRISGRILAFQTMGIEVMIRSILEDERSHSPDIHFEPVVKLPLMEVKTLEEDEEVLIKLRGKLYRYVKKDDEPAEWKERGTGEVKILRNAAGYCRVLMRRDKTFKVCANHYVCPSMELQPCRNSDKAWAWTTPADFADEEAKPELLALRFGSVEKAKPAREEVPTKELESLAIKEEDDGLLSTPSVGSPAKE